MIDIVIPTMWMAKDFDQALEIYTNHVKIAKIIVVDNNPKSRPQWSVLNHAKVELVSYNRNIFVNPAWNEGYYRARSDILGIVNDDIVVSADVIDMVGNFPFESGDLIGVNLRGRQNNYRIDDVIDTAEEIVRLPYDDTKPIGGQAWAFGICMFMMKESYQEIPSLYQVWYGDDYFAQRAKRVFAINSNRIKGTISETLTKFDDPDSEISCRIELDSKNLLAYGHFKNSKNWDIPHNMINMYSQKRLAKNINLPKINDKKTIDNKVNIFDQEYHWARSIASDINENVHILYELAQECKTVVEFGVRTGVSTRAFLASDVELLSFDIELHHKVRELFLKAQAQGKSVQYIKADVLDIRVEPMDLLFIDTLHTYEQLAQELALHGNKARRYIAFHDTYTFGLRGEDGRDRRGLLTAIIEFQIKNPHWRFRIHKTNNNGFTVLERHPQGQT
jgi:predicted O-methyltransferase YrrM